MAHHMMFLFQMDRNCPSPVSSALWTNGQMDGGGRGVGEGHKEKNKAFHAA